MSFYWDSLKVMIPAQLQIIGNRVLGLLAGCVGNLSAVCLVVAKGRNTPGCLAALSSRDGTLNSCFYSVPRLSGNVRDESR